MCDYCLQKEPLVGNPYCSQVCEELALIGPVAFTHCASHGGRVRTIKPSADTYMHVCYRGGKSYSGEVKHVGECLDRHHTAVEMTPHLKVQLCGDRYDDMGPSELRALVRRLSQAGAQSQVFVPRAAREEIKALVDEIQDRAKTVENLNAQIRTLQEQQTRLLQDPTRLDLQQKRLEMQKLEQERQALFQRNQELREERNELQTLVQQAFRSDEINALRQQVAREREATAAMQRRVDALERQLAQAAQQLSQADATARIAVQGQSDLQQQLRASEEARKKAQENVERVRVANAEFRRRLADLQEKTERGTLATKQETDRAMADLRAELEMVRGAAGDHLRHLKEEMAKKEALDRQLAEFRQRLVDAARGREYDARALADSAAREGLLKQELADKVQTIEQLQATLEAEKKQIAERMQKMVEHIHAIEEKRTPGIHGRLASLEAQLHAREAELERLRSVAKDLASTQQRENALRNQVKQLQEAFLAAQMMAGGGESGGDLAKENESLRKRYDKINALYKKSQEDQTRIQAQKRIDDQVIYNMQLQLEKFLYLQELKRNFKTEQEETRRLLQSLERLRTLPEVQRSKTKLAQCAECELTALVQCKHCDKKYCAKHHMY